MNKSKKFQLSNVLTVSIAHLIHDIYSSFLAPILPLLIEKLSISYALAGFLSVMQRLPSLLNPVLGIVADKISVRYFIIIAPALTTVTMSLLGVAPNYTVLAILLFVMGVSSSLFHVPAPVLIKEVSGERVGKGMSFYMLGGELARTVGPLTILGAVSLWGLEGTYRLIPFGLSASLLLFFKLRNIQPQSPLDEKNGNSNIKDTVVKFLPFFVVISGVIFFRGIMKAALTSFLPTFLNVRGESLWMGGIALSVLEGAGAVGTLLSGTISDFLGRKTTLLIISIITPVMMWLFVVVDSTFTIPILIIMGFFMFANGPVMLALVQDYNSDRPAFINGIYMALNFILSSLSILIIGIMADFMGLETTFKLSAIIALAGIPCLFLIPDPKKVNSKKN